MTATPSQKAALLVTTLMAFLTPYMGSSINVALPAIGEELVMDAVSLGWVSTSYLLAAAMFVVPVGRVADIYGRKRIFNYGVFIFTIGSLLVGLSQNAAMLILLRFVQGIGGSMVFGTGVAILSAAFPVNERGRVLGINVAAVYCGLSVGPLLGGFLTELWGWRSIFFLAVPLGLSIIVLIRLKLHNEWREAKGETFDWLGACLSGAGLAFLVYGFSLLPNVQGFGVIGLGFVFLLGFYLQEGKTESPLLDFALFKTNKTFAFSNLATFLHYTSLFAVAFLVSLYLQYIKDLSPRVAGMLLMAQPIIMMLVSPLAGRISDRRDPRIVATVGMSIMAVGLFCFTIVGFSTPLWFIILGLLVLGLGVALFSSPNTNAVMSSVQKKEYGVASSIISTMRLTGQMFSMAIVMLIFSYKLGRIAMNEGMYVQFLQAMHIAFVIFVLLSCMGIAASWAGSKKAKFIKKM